MPFVQRVVEPKYLSRTSLWNDDGKPRISDNELEAVINNTLSNALRQLASLVLVADDIFTELGNQLQSINARSEKLKLKINNVEENVAAYDPKKVTVPESDICSFALLKTHYITKHELDTNLFAVKTRPAALQALYDSATKTPVNVMRQLDRWRRDGHRSSRFFLCTPVLGTRKRKIKYKVDIEIETRMPAAVEELRRWTSDEALGDITVTPDCPNRISANVTQCDATDGTIISDDEAIDHKLPSPEEQVQVVALKFPAEVVTVDISGKSFDRMSLQRRSLLQGDISCQTDGDTVRRRTRTRRPRSKRRNTLAGTDQKEIQDAITAGDQQPSCSAFNSETETTATSNVGRSRSSDILRVSHKKESPEIKKSHFNTIKQWGKTRYDRFMNKSAESKYERKSDDIDDFNIYETVTMKRKRNIDKRVHQRSASVSSSEKSTSNLPISSTLSGVMNIAVKLRESSAQRREKRAAVNKDEPHSSSGNWSASSESARNSLGSEITTTTQPKSTTSAATSSNSLNLPVPSSANSRRRFNVNTSTSSSVTSEGTLTPDIIHDLHEDGETSSVYSCDTEGYYTSFHMDSGLKTLKEEDLPMTPLHSTSAINTGSNSSAENEYELFGKGSTSTTTSSAGTVCTTLRAANSERSLIIGPAVPERRSSLLKSNTEDSPENSIDRDYNSDKTGTVKRSPATSKANVLNVNHKVIDGDVSPDSGHNTSSSPIESINSPLGMRSGSDFEFSESSDMEGPERIERIRIKTTINSSRIPSMCVITPSQSDDESSQSSFNSHKESLGVDYVDHNVGNKDGRRPKSDLLIQNDGTKSNKLMKHSVVKANKVQFINVNQQSGYATIESVLMERKAVCTDINQNTANITTNKSVRAASPSGGSVIIKEEVPTNKITQPIIKSTLLPLNTMFGKLKSNIVSLTQKRESKSPNRCSNSEEVVTDLGEYVTIADVRNNNKNALNRMENTYANDIVNKNLKTILSGKMRETEYVSLNELPCNEKETEIALNVVSNDSLERKKRQGARVTLDAEGKVVYSSDSLKRCKGAHTTFEPGPFVKPSDSPCQSPLPGHRTSKPVRPVTSQDQKYLDPACLQSTQHGKVVIKASTGIASPTSEIIRMPPSTIVSPNARPTSPKSVGRGAYVHVQDAVKPLSPTANKEFWIPVSSEYQMHQSFTTLDNPNLKQHYIPTDYSNYQGEMYEENFGQYPNNQYYLSRGAHMYQTLPIKRVQQTYLTDVYQERSVTPDITRGLDRNFIPKDVEEQVTANFDYDEKHSVPGNVYTIDQSLLKQKLGIPVTVPNVYNYPQSIPDNQINYNYESHSDIRVLHHNSFKTFSTKADLYSPSISTRDNHNNESLRISPIDPRNSGGFQSSTPSHKNPPHLKAAANLDSKILLPRKSTMSNDELYAVIHKSKKKMNIATNKSNSTSPVSSPESSRIERVKSPETGYLGDKTKSRLSWSPTKGEYLDFDTNIDNLSPPNQTRSRQSWACNDRKGNQSTSRLDFKKLLLQKSTNIFSNNSKKLTAVEQLKLSKQVPPKSQLPEMSILELSGSPRSLVNRKFSSNPSGSPQNNHDKVKPSPKLMSPRSQWRFASPRSDVLSSTILEDCREDENCSNNSFDKKRSPHRLNFDENETAKFESTNIRKQDYKHNLEDNIKQQYTPLSQRIQAQRAQFFNTGIQNNNSVSQLSSQPNNPPSIPTLETSF